MRVLVVDDEADIRRVVSDFLSDCGHDVLTARDGVDALTQLAASAPVDAIVSDVRMPRMDGLDLLRTLRVRHPGIPVILMTGHGDESVATAALQQGAQDYLKKPVALHDLMHCMAQIDERRRLESQMLNDFRSIRRGGLISVAAAPEETAVRRADFLLVTNDTDTTDALATVLRQLGHALHVEADAESALRRFHERAIDIVIMAVDLPDADGIDLAAEMRAIDPTVIPLIVSDRPDRETLIRAMECGAVGYLSQPLDELELRRLITRALTENKRLSDMRLLLGDLIEGRSELQANVVERERYLSHLIDAAPFGIVSTDSNGDILTFNGKAERIHGYAEDQVKGRPLSVLFADPADHSGLDPAGAKPVRRRHRNKNGELVPVLVHSIDVLDNGKRHIARLHVIEDRTEREHVEEQLLQAERLSVLGQMAPRIAHEFKTPLQAIIGSADLARTLIEDGETREAGECIGDMIPAVQSMNDLVQQMLNLGKPAVSRNEPIDLAAQLLKLLQVLRPMRVLQQCTVEVDCAEESPSIMGDPAQIEQALRNLIVNAAHAMEGTGQQRLYLGVHPENDGRHVVVTVRDTGCGIAPQHLERMFQPFFTTKPEGRGTGLGLPIVKTVLDRHGALAQVESVIGLGTTFRIVFPSHVPDASSTPRTPFTPQFQKDS